MDDFKKAKSDYITSNDLYCRYVSYKPKARRRALQIANKLARRRLKQDLDKACEIIEVFSAHEKLYKQQLSRNPEQLNNSLK